MCGVSQQFRQLVINVWCHIGSIDGRSIKHKLSVVRNFLSSGSPTEYTIILPPAIIIPDLTSAKEGRGSVYDCTLPSAIHFKSVIITLLL